MARSMLEHRHVSKKFWVEAVNTVVYLSNRSPTVAVKGRTLEEAWLGRKLRISHLKVFGSLAYVWIPDASNTKLDAKSQKLMLAEYSSLHKAYRLIDIETSRLQYSRDVVFDEQQGAFMPVSPVPDSADQPMKAHDLGVRLPLGPSPGRAPAAQVALVLPVFPVQRPPSSPPGSPIYANASLDFDPDPSNEEPIIKDCLIIMLVLLSGLNCGLGHLLIFGVLSSSKGELFGKRANLQRLSILLSWPTFTVCFNRRHT